MRYLLSFLALLGAGCTHPSASYRMQVSSLGTSPPARYHLAPADPRVDPNDPQFREYAAYAHRILQNRGFTPADTPSAEQFILLEYGVGMPSARLGFHRHTAYTPNPSCEVTGQDEKFQAVKDAYDVPADFHSVWPCHMAFLAYNADKLRQSQGREKVQLWSTIATCSGRSPDLRQVMPALVAAAERYLGTDTRRARHVTIAHSDLLVLVKGIGPTPAGQFRTSMVSDTAWDLFLSYSPSPGEGLPSLSGPADSDKPAQD
jgi:hypothetical protein